MSTSTPQIVVQLTSVDLTNLEITLVLVVLIWAIFAAIVIGIKSS